MIIYHNPRCRKSRETLALIREKGIEPEVVEYLKNPLQKAELVDLVQMLGMPAAKIIRKGEAIFKSDYKGKDLSESEWIEAMAAHPVLMERPIVVSGNKAIVGRPPENVEELL